RSACVARRRHAPSPDSMPRGPGMAAGVPRRPRGQPRRAGQPQLRAIGRRRLGVPVTTEKEKTMIFHINRMTYKTDLSEGQRRAGLELCRQAGAANPAVKSYVVGPELGGGGEGCAADQVDGLGGDRG